MSDQGYLIPEKTKSRHEKTTKLSEAEGRSEQCRADKTLCFCRESHNQDPLTLSVS